MRDLIVERLTGATGDPVRVVEAARALADRCVATAGAAMAEAFGPAVSFECSDVRLTRSQEARPPAGSAWTMTVAAAEVSPDALLMTMEPLALSLMVSALFGGDDTLPPVPIERELSSIEIDVAAQMFDIFAHAFNGTGDRSLAVRFPLPRPITGADLAKQVLRDGPAVSITFAVRLGDNAGNINVTMPQRVLAAHRGDASPVPARGAAAWRERFNEEAMRSEVRLEATMPLATLTLGEIAALRPGQVIEMPQGAQAQTKLHAKDRTLFVCEFGKLGQNYTVRITHPFDAQQEFVDGLMGGEPIGDRRH